MALHRATDVDGPHACVRGRLAPSLPRLIAQDGKKGLPAMRQVHVQRRCSDQMMGSLTRSIEIGLLMLCSCQKSIECMQVVYVKVDENKPIVGAHPRSTPPLGALHPDSFTSIEKQCRCTPSTLRARMPDRKVMFGRRWPSISRRREVCLQS
jgi:hypothetical protein